MAATAGETKGFNGMINNFLVGCDPEWAALDGQGKVMGLIGHLNHAGEIGYDHHGRVGEFRPEPTKGTYALVKKLHRLINSPTMQAIRAVKLRAGARIDRESLGGHVHFGFKTPQVQHGTYTSAPAVVDIRVQALDRITSVLENLDILPKEESANRRKGSYGHFSDVRDSNGHLEYRTMASWLYDPKVAYLCLTGAKLAASDAQGTVDNLKKSGSFSDLVNWFTRYRTKDINARRAVDRVLASGHKAIQVYPDVDFKERWVTLGL